MTKFDPNAAATDDSGVFGLPYNEAEAALVYLPVPWEATTSYGGGTSEGPRAILAASRQVDLFDMDVFRPYEPGLFMLPEDKRIREWNRVAKEDAQKIIAASGIVEGNPSLTAALENVNRISAQVNEAVYAETKRLIAAGKIVGLIGGDHASPFGAFQAIGEKHPGFGILHFDAHSDTRKAYEGFTWSHASIMYNALENIRSIGKIVQVGIRDLCEEEYDYALACKHRMQIFFDRDNSRRKMEGITWAQIAREIVAQLPQEVWVSFDIDGLDPRYCPHTGTPVPGGLEFQEANYILRTIVASGRKIIGFDLNEVAPNLENPDDEWDANVGARLLYKLSAWTLVSQSKAKLQV